MKAQTAWENKKIFSKNRPLNARCGIKNVHCRWQRHVRVCIATASFVITTSMHTSNDQSSSHLGGRYNNALSWTGGDGGVFSVILDGANAVIGML